jgi:serine/threonine protein kinase
MALPNFVNIGDTQDLIPCVSGGSLESSTNSSVICDKLKILQDNFTNINTTYFQTSSADFESMITKVNYFDPTRLKMLVIEMYNIINNVVNCDNEDDILENNASFRNVKFKSFRAGSFRQLKALSQTDCILRTINEYIIVDEIGNGAQAQVHLGVHEKTGEQCAIKEIRNVRQWQKNVKNSAYDLIQREVAIMKNLDHDHIVKLKDVIESTREKKMYIVMEYISNGTILKKDENDENKYIPLPLEKVIKYTKQINSGLRYLHHHQIVHKDIKPENLLLGENDKVIIADFGISVLLKRRRSSVASRNGTYLFFAPEMFLLDDTIDGYMTDIWAFGVTIFIMLYGNFPFNGVNQEDLKNNVLYSSPDFPQNATSEQKKFFEKILCKDPKNRLTLKEMRNHPFLKYAKHKSADHLNTAQSKTEHNHLEEYVFASCEQNEEQNLSKMVPVLPLKDTNELLLEVPPNTPTPNEIMHDDKLSSTATFNEQNPLTQFSMPPLLSLVENRKQSRISNEIRRISNELRQLSDDECDSSYSNFASPTFSELKRAISYADDNSDTVSGQSYTDIDIISPTANEQENAINYLDDSGGLNDEQEFEFITPRSNVFAAKEAAKKYIPAPPPKVEILQ